MRAVLPGVNSLVRAPRHVATHGVGHAHAAVVLGRDVAEVGVEREVVAHVPRRFHVV